MSYNVSVASRNLLQVCHAVFFPFPKNWDTVSVVEQIKGNIKQYCSNLRKRPNSLNYTFNSFLSMDDLWKSLYSLYSLYR